MKIFLDTNIFLRLSVPEDPRVHEQCTQLMQVIQAGSLVPYTSNIVLMEYVYVITKTYGQSKKSVLEDLDKIMRIRNLILIEKTDIDQALNIYKERTLKFSDCLIATQVPKGATLCTYDTDFTKIPHLETVTPADILKRFTSES